MYSHSSGSNWHGIFLCIPSQIWDMHLFVGKWHAKTSTYMGKLDINNERGLLSMQDCSIDGPAKHVIRAK
jgi:hypothetical protein